MPGDLVDPTGALAWAVRGSLVRYVTVIARGEYSIDGGVGEREDGQFVFALRRAVREGDDWRLSFTGTLHFVAHHGLLDILILDPELVIGPEGGVLATHTSGDSEELVALVTVDPATPIVSDGELRWPEVPTQLAGAAVEMFGNVYPAGTDMAPLRISVPVDG